MIRLFLLFLLLNLTAVRAFASSKGPDDYIIDSFIVQAIFDGGYYSLGAIGFLAFLCFVSKKLKTLIFSFLFAIAIIMMLIFAYEALDNWEWIPRTY